MHDWQTFGTLFRVRTPRQVVYMEPAAFLIWKLRRVARFIYPHCLRTWLGRTCERGTWVRGATPYWVVNVGTGEIRSADRVFRWR